MAVTDSGQGPADRARTDFRLPVIVGAAAIVLALGGFGAWATTAPIASAVIAPGKLIVHTKRKEVQHLKGGLVADIAVRDGDVVDSGDLLVRLDDTRAGASLGILSGAYHAALALEARLRAERVGRGEIDFSALRRDRVGDADVDDVIAGQQALFVARREAQAGERTIQARRIDQLQQEIVGLEAQQVAKERQIGIIRDELESLESLFAKGLTTQQRVLALRREAARLEGERGEHIAEIARTRTKIGETELQVLQLDNRVREQVEAELREVQEELCDHTERLGAARDVVDRIEIRAPVGGTVVGLDVHTVGGVVDAGEAILEIVPSADRLVVEARVGLIDIDNVVIGLDADVHFTAFKQRSTPVATGRVTYVSADSLTEETSGDVFYVAHVEVPDEELARLGGKELQAGMPADVIIKTGERTPLAYLIQPILDSMNRAWREE